MCRDLVARGARSGPHPPRATGPAPSPPARWSSGAEGRPVLGLHPAKSESGRRLPRAAPTPLRQPQPQPVSCGPALAPPPQPGPVLKQVSHASTMRLGGLVPGEGPLPRWPVPGLVQLCHQQSPSPQALESGHGWEGSKDLLYLYHQAGSHLPATAWTRGGGERPSRGHKGDKHTLRVLRLLRSAVPTCILGVVGSPTLPETQPVRSSTAWGEVGLGTH